MRGLHSAVLLVRMGTILAGNATQRAGRREGQGNNEVATSLSKQTVDFSHSMAR